MDKIKLDQIPKPKGIIRLMIEILSVVFAILLALFIEKSFNDYEEDVITDKTLSYIEKEIRSNRRYLNKYFKKNQAKALLLDSLLSIDPPPKAFDYEEVSSILMNFGAWEIGKMKKSLYHLEYKMAKDLFNLYDVQGRYNTILTEHVIHDVDPLKIEVEKNGGYSIDYVIHEKRLLESIIPLEKTLIKRYDRVLKNYFSDDD